jgi:hypothetical protein
MGEVSTKLYVGDKEVAETILNGQFVAINPYTIPIDFLVAAGGGGGGSSNAGGGGGGGAGGVVTGSFVSFFHPLTIVVGAGGAAGSCGEFLFDAGANGSNSYIVQPAIAHIALGGGGGGGVTGGTQNGKAGGSGGGGSMVDSTAYSGGTGLQPTAASIGFGNDGGNASGVFQGTGGAGGGAGSAASGTVNGGAYQWLDVLDYGRGGYANSGDSCAIQAPANSANGGGPCENSIYIGPFTQCGGASGIVKLRYPGSKVLASGGTITSSGGYTYHTFTSSGQLIWNIN